MLAKIIMSITEKATKCWLKLKVVNTIFHKVAKPYVKAEISKILAWN